jgi:ribosomal protection tetracycline resistance protein
MPLLNLGVLAHVDAGKTSLTERLLFETGAIDRLGSVDGGDTRTDTLALERRRGITIKNAVASFALDDLTITLIDTPGHPDFIAEVERALRVLDGAVLVVSAVEGVQPQTRVILRTLRQLRVPTLVFINKVDRAGADPDAAIRGIPDAVPLWRDDREIRDTVAEYDASALAAAVEDRPLPPGVLPRLVAAGRVLPGYRGSAITGEGVDALLGGIATLLPHAPEDVDGPLEAVVFAIDREHTASVRVRTGVLRLRDHIGDDRVTAIDGGDGREVRAGRIARVHGLRSARIGDVLGTGNREGQVFAPPTLSALIEPLDPARSGDLHTALQRLAEQDPLIDLRVDALTGGLTVSLYGEVQKEVLRDTLAEEDGIPVSFSDSTVLLRERPTGSTTVGAVIQKGDNRHFATLELTVEPAEPAEGVIVDITAPREQLPLYIYGTADGFTEAMSRYVRAALQRGGPHGWEVIDTRVVITRSGYIPPLTRAADFRRLTEQLIEQALTTGGTTLCEPVQRVMIEGTDSSMPALISTITGLSGSIERAEITGPLARVTATLRAARLSDLERSLPGITHGSGTLETTFAEWRPMIA